MTARRSDYQPRTRRYTMEEYGDHEDERGVRGNHVTRKDVTELQNPSYDQKDPHTVLRILPTVSFDDPNAWEPMRYKAKANAFGDWIRVYTMALGVGNPPVSYICFDPAENNAYNMDHDPLMLIYRAIQDAIKDKRSQPHWPALLNGQPGRRAELTRPGKSALTQALIFKRGSRSYKDSPLGGRDGDKTVVIQYGRSATTSLMTAILQPREDFDGDPEDDYNAPYAAGDIVDLNAGKFVHIVAKGYDPFSRSNNAPTGHRERRHATLGGGRPAAGGPAETKAIGYDVIINDDFEGIGPELPDSDDVVRGIVKPWDDILLFPTPQEQVELLIGRLPADVILFALRDFAHLLPDRDSPAGRQLYETETGRSSVAGSTMNGEDSDDAVDTNGDPDVSRGATQRKRATLGGRRAPATPATDASVATLPSAAQAPRVKPGSPPAKSTLDKQIAAKQSTASATIAALKAKFAAKKNK